MLKLNNDMNELIIFSSKQCLKKPFAVLKYRYIADICYKILKYHALIRIDYFLCYVRANNNKTTLVKVTHIENYPFDVIIIGCKNCHLRLIDDCFN